MRYPFILLVIFSSWRLEAQDVDCNVLSRDSFPSFVKEVLIKGYLAGGLEVGQFDSSWTISQTYMEFDNTGHWIARIDMTTDGTLNDDTIWYDARTHTKFLKQRSANNPSLTSVAYNPDGTVNSIFYDLEEGDDIVLQYGYDKQKRMTRFSQTFAGQETVDALTYNKKNGLLEKKSTTSGYVGNKHYDLINEQEYVYNNKKQLVKTYDRIYGEHGFMRMCDTIWYTYTDAGLMESMKESRQNGNTKMLTKYAYDEKGRMISKEYTYSTEVQPEPQNIYKEWKYDDQGNWTMQSEEGEDGTGSTETWKIIYNDKGLPETCTYEDEAEIFYYKWEYVYR